MVDRVLTFSFEKKMNDNTQDLFQIDESGSYDPFGCYIGPEKLIQIPKSSGKKIIGAETLQQPLAQFGWGRFLRSWVHDYNR